LKARLREPGVFDVNAMSIFLENDLITEKFLVCLLNSYFVFKYQKTFINSTSAFQINDARQLPIVIPNDVQLRRFEEIFDRAEALKLQQYANPANTNEADAKLALLQQDLDQSILELYGVEDSPEFQPKQ
jgi:restriction endonuclease S subunit